MAIGAISGQLSGERQGTVVAQENDKNNKMKVGIANQPVNAEKSVNPAEKDKESSIVEQQNKENSTMQTGIDNQNLNDVKGVQEVDVRG